MEMVGEAEKRLAQLHKERENLEGRLQRTPRAGGRVTRDAKQTQVKAQYRTYMAQYQGHSTVTMGIHV